MNGKETTYATSELTPQTGSREQLTKVLKGRLTRRELLYYGGMVGMSLSALWALACQPTAPAAATPTKPAAPVVPTPTKAPAAPKLEGVEILPGFKPAKYSEAPMLAELVKAGKLPPVAQRLPEEPLVYKPIKEIGKYGGTWRRGFTGPADEQNPERLMHDHLVYWDTQVTKVVPHIAKGWEISDEGRTYTFFLRKGMKWSDGQPFSADDIMFWYQDVYLNKDLVPAKEAWSSYAGKETVLEKVDDYAVRFKFAAPYYTFLEEIASLGYAGHFTRGEVPQGWWSPKHYMKQFHPNYVPLADLDKKAKDAKFDNWVSYFKFLNNPLRNVECPTTSYMRATTPVTTPVLTLERNPYCFIVDNEGNQLPYMDKLVMTLAENLEVLNLRAIAGEYDIQMRHIGIAKVPVFKENQAKGNYTVKFWPWPHGTDAGFFVNQNFDADPEIRKWLTNKDFRIALSLGIQRDQLNEVFWLGLGDPGGPCPGSQSPYFPGKEYRTLHSTFDPKKANEMLDKLGLDKKDSEGFRLRTDGKGRLVLEVTTVGAAFVEWTNIAEMVREHWGKNIGIKANVTEVERSLMVRRNEANELQMRVWSNDGSDNPWTYPHHLMTYLPASAIGPLSGLWYQTGGAKGVKPEGDLMKMVELLDKGKGLPMDKRIEVGKEMLRISADNVWVIGTVGVSPALMGVLIVKNNIGNIPEVAVGSTPAQTKGNTRPEQFYFKS